MRDRDEATALHDALPVGYRLHHYRIEAVLGASPFWIVYKAMYETLGIHRAIKEYFPVAWSSRKHHEADLLIAMRDTSSPSTAEDTVVAETSFAWGLERFLHEARILAQVSHPGVVPIRDFFEANGTAYLVMDYADGEPLDRLLRRENTLAEARIRRLLDDVLPALEAMHALGYLHCDLRPAHLYGRADGRTLLIGFGSARPARAGRGAITLLSRYTPIELFLAEGEGRCGPWTDLYALGAVLYRCVTGVKPPSAQSRGLDDPLRLAEKVAAGPYSPALLRLIERAMAVRPEQRFQTAAQMRAALE